MSTVFLPDWLRPEGKNPLIRVGCDRDGGYVVSVASLANSENALSFGVGDEVSFEVDLLGAQFVRSVDCYDHTIDGKELLKKYLKARILFFARNDKRRRQIQEYRRYSKLFSQHNARHLPMRVGGADGLGATTFTSALDRIAGSGNVFLKCDIEGSEYEILDDIVGSQKRLSGLAIEFHDVSKKLGDIQCFIEGIKENFILDHVHVNNNGGQSEEGVPEVIELSLTRRGLTVAADILDKIGVSRTVALDGRSLDRTNEPGREDMQIEFSGVTTSARTN